MARARNLKPGFFLNEDLVELPFETRLLFAGLWTIADREGRLEDRPAKIKMAIFPADSVDVDTSLELLAERELIIRYVIDGKRYIEITNFLKHQNPHNKEAASLIPAPDSPSARTVSAVPLTSSLNPDSPIPIGDVWVNGEKRTAEKPRSLPTSSENEINVWLDAVAPFTGAKNRTTLANPKAWRDAVEKAMRDGRELTDFLKATEAEALRNKGTPQFFTPTNVLKVVQAKAMKTDKWANC